ncbi:Co/Zn/Cd efflux system component [Cryobacterium mesophilum]|uniref:cation transporter n=1 Tax=Terrimesophilobacter mesophilus TaxID=433647 RepID=UPI00179B6D50|nr:cation transporter [Terrimesophilobacter mesophilus]MBB5632215.1 Co/Zn/Cd efflux system component [Terrimesophilobacter mesophilus]
MTGFRRAVLLVGLLNLGYFGIEFTTALLIGSVSLFADSVDFLEDTSINLLIFVAVLWSPRARSTVGRVLAVVIMVPAVVTFVTAIVKIFDPVAPAFAPMSLAALGALVVNLACAFILMRHRHHEGSLSRAAWLSARNDALANVGIIAAAFVAIPLQSGWPDIIVGIAIGLLNLDAARAVWRVASDESRQQLEPEP